MGYIDSHLLPNETVVSKARLHWFVYLKAIAVMLLGAGLAAIEPTIGAIIAGVGLLLMVPPFIAYTSSEFGVTNKRVIIKVGVLRRKTLELLIRQVEAISVDQSISGRIFNYGTITLTGTGGVREQFHNISRPLDFRRAIQGLASELVAEPKGVRH